MALYPELNEAIESVLSATKESAEYRRRLKKLIEMAFSGNYRDQDVREVIDLVATTEDLRGQ